MFLALKLLFNRLKRMKPDAWVREVNVPLGLRYNQELLDNKLKRQQRKSTKTNYHHTEDIVDPEHDDRGLKE
ncbi:hypothetical protein DEO72_LG2g1995 [Vigna unguiculata]|uniref:Uncharacterized protein n=1 Tax=Vigna unguiculata TaxID=3917 RepID=A0A4D6KYK0_VIGUN|nr:hypothetical protein DEO72_LG2g1995 [Vigna unguiculata]